MDAIVNRAVGALKLRSNWIQLAKFGVVVTSSVKVAGVLLIFSLLIIPAVTAVISTKGTVKRIIFLDGGKAVG